MTTSCRSSQRRYHAYMLRLWVTTDTDGSAWRATLESVSDSERRSFVRPEELVAFLHKSLYDENQPEE